MQVVETYTFSPGPAGTGTVEIPEILELEDFYSIINVSKGSILYCPKEGHAGAEISYDVGTTILTLEQTTTYCDALDKLQILVYTTGGGGGGGGNSNIYYQDPEGTPVAVTPSDPLPVNIQGATLSLDADGVEIRNDVGNPVPVNGTVNTLEGLNIPPHDYINLGYTGSNLTSVVYKTGGSGGTTVATLTLSYDGSNNLISVTKS
jgi:hypothetical protein